MVLLIPSPTDERLNSLILTIPAVKPSMESSKVSMRTSSLFCLKDEFKALARPSVNCCISGILPGAAELMSTLLAAGGCGVLCCAGPPAVSGVICDVLDGETAGTCG